ncbi:putative competence-damage inducible protein [Weizmannia acidilactici]|jgi:nicotinamide-nucleotide amidase|uniref:Putative competence-damage inducible protein n=1 Tax=Weizmannia acidilactici TaxID=2607726 RepID=A0A5J4JEI2_9BACI|nr:competence/damage-inducible protein A [Weizmannia acidilactici]GER65695.1 putative competence-damage inducible protein [Weizmannia acidilactici]GER68975.1 putative competence-damage inducible protein [Weizmannia acidilactici]GER72052.1 putative competence-damage inducible protein [Weizmannia acidilactici]
MNAEIIAVGSELLLGQIVNTNAKFIAEHLAEIGVDVYYQTVVGDNPGRLEEAIKTAEARADLLIFTGGLGPTKDDLTKETIAFHIGKKLVTDEVAMRSIKQFFARTKRNMTENNKKQALVIEGSKVLPNDHGMAPGMFAKQGNHYYMLLPGPPHEMEPMFINYGSPAIQEELETIERIESRVLRFFGIGESQLETEVQHIIDSQSNPTVAPLASEGEVTLRITAKHESAEIANKMIDEKEKEILQIVGQYFYGYNETTLMEALLKKLSEKQLTLACAESLTAGMFESEMAAIQGVSTMLKGGIVVYSNEAKMKLANVKKETLDQYGAVSKECAIELAENVRRLLSADIGISFTGVAGPDSLEGHPPGTVWIGITVKGKETGAHLLELAGSRNNVRRRTVKYGCYYLLQMLGK